VILEYQRWRRRRRRRRRRKMHLDESRIFFNIFFLSGHIIL